MMRPVLDTCILADFLSGSELARKEIQRYQRPYISAITWMEMMMGAQTASDSALVSSFLMRFTVIEVDEAVRKEAIAVRREFKCSLADAIQFAAAKLQNTLLITRNASGFPSDSPMVRVPY
jgi:predicted nucleic acid-binding protein